MLGFCALKWGATFVSRVLKALSVCVSVWSPDKSSYIQLHFLDSDVIGTSIFLQGLQSSSDRVPAGVSLSKRSLPPNACWDAFQLGLDPKQEMCLYRIGASIDSKASSLPGSFKSKTQLRRTVIKLFLWIGPMQSYSIVGASDELDFLCRVCFSIWCQVHWRLPAAVVWKREMVLLDSARYYSQFLLSPRISLHPRWEKGSQSFHLWNSFKRCCS